MIKLLNSIRDSIAGAIGYLRMHKHENNDELDECRETAENDLVSAVREIDDYLESHENN